MTAWIVIDQRHFTQRVSCEGFTQSGLREGPRQPARSPRLPIPISFTSLVSHLPYSLPSSVSRNSFVWHSYEDCRVVCQQFPTWKIPIALKRNSQPAFVFKFFLFTFLRTLLHRKKLNSFLFKRFRTLCSKTPGVGYPLSMWPRLIASKVE